MTEKSFPVDKYVVRVRATAGGAREKRYEIEAVSRDHARTLAIEIADGEVQVEFSPGWQVGVKPVMALTFETL